MRAVALNYRDRTLAAREIPEPDLRRDDEVLFRVREIGVCGTDRALAAFRLLLPPAGDDFLVLGHECVGEVVRTGAAVSSVKRGDVVVPIVRRPCAPPCDWCAGGRRDLCSTGKYTERGILGAHGYYTELAVDLASDLVTVPVAYQEFAVLVEPLSVVEKAVSSAFRLHPGAPSTALVLGAGAVGLLSAMVLRNRGLDVTVLSLEPADSERARLAREAGAEYVCSLADRVFDVVIEAAGAPAAALVALKAIGPAGVFVVLGVTQSVEVPMLPLILRNQVVAGSVNAAPRDFIAAVEDLARFPAKVLSRMIAREPWDTFRSTLLGPLSGTPKVVHVWT